MTINDGHLDLTGGGIPIENGEMTDLGGTVGDLLFFYDWSENLALSNPLRAHDEEFLINFTGPGSITVDEAGIRVLRQPAQGDPTDPLTASDWTGRDVQVSYLDLWNAGILQANGLSGKTGTIFGDGNTPKTLLPADFNDFFMVTNNPGDNNYILTSLIAATPVPGVAGDYNGNGVVDGADYVMFRNGGPLQNEVATIGSITIEDYNEWRARFGNTAGSGAGLGTGAVPEPGTALLMLVGLISFVSFKRMAR